MVNIMGEYTKFNEKCFHKYLKLIFDNKYDKKIAQEFIEAYIEIRYSDYIDEESTKVSFNKKISKVLDDTYKKLIAENDEKLITLIKHFRHFADYLFTLDQLYLLESQKKTIEKIAADRTKLLELSEDKFIITLYDMLREDIKKKKDFLDSFDSTMFYLEMKKISKTEFGVELANKLVFPELYSETAIKKVAARDNISEDIGLITFMQITKMIIMDLIECNFEKKYFAYVPSSFFSKKVKLTRLLNVIDSPYVEEKLRCVITYDCFVKYKNNVMDFMREGFVFGIYLDDSFDYSSENIEFLELFDKIFIKSDKYYYKDMKNNVKIRDRIVSVDEVK